MSIVTINLQSKQFQLACSPDSEKQLLTLASELNKTLSKMKEANPSASFELLLVMTALSAEDRIMTLESELGRSAGDPGMQDNQQFAETLNTIAGYLENLAQKISK